MTTSSLRLHAPFLSLAILAFSLLVLSCGRCAAREVPGEGHLRTWDWHFIEGFVVCLIVSLLAVLLFCVCRRGKGGAVAAVEGSREWSRATAGPPKSDHYMSINASMVRSAQTTPDARPRSSDVSPDSRRLPPSPEKLLWMLLALPVPADERAPAATQHGWPPVQRPEKDAVIMDPFSPCSRASWARPKELDYERLQVATNDFHMKSRMRKPGCQWVVYKGTKFVADDGLPAVVVIKRFHEIISTEQRERMVDDLSRMTTLQHKNVVSLLGYSFGNGYFHLVYSYMPNRSLDKRLFREPRGTGLTWPLRYSMVNDVARALYHLHVTNVPHGSIKASNILLEQDFAARLHGHFGYQPDQSNTPRGSLEADMLQFGVLILQVVCGPQGRSQANTAPWACFIATVFNWVQQCKIATVNEEINLHGRGSPAELVDWVWTLHGESRLLEAVDPAARVDDFNFAQATKLLLIALSCTYPDPAARLTIYEVRMILSDQAPLPEVPPSKPT
ncbi:L-type lectin-domain containing receptor kinase VIII.2 [Triticum aestivum]|nr:L-type lectin-domain containing receptor kinase VIII.2-like [Triticum aestivum]